MKSDKAKPEVESTDPQPKKPVERLFPFVLRARTLLTGQDTLARSKSKLHFILVTTDLSEGSRQKILSEYSHYPVVQFYTSADLEQFFGLKGTKGVGFKKSTLAQSVYAELKQHRLNPPSKNPPSAREGESSQASSTHSELRKD
jgi:hypothetical protein